jgi:hypothetical protein
LTSSRHPQGAFLLPLTTVIWKGFCSWLGLLIGISDPQWTFISFDKIFSNLV